MIGSDGVLFNVQHFVSYQISSPPRSTACMACTSLQPLPSRMVSVPMAVPGGRGIRRRGGGGAVWRHPAPWEVGRENVIGILVEAKKEVKISKSP